MVESTDLVAAAPTVGPPKALAVETRTFEFVPLSERFGTLSEQRKFWFTINSGIVTIFTGTVGPLFGLGLGWTIIAIIAGSLVGTVFQALHAAQGPVMGLPQMIQSRAQFGSRGALLPLIAGAITLAGYPVFSVQTAASALNTVAAVDFSAAQAVIGVVAIAVAIFGFKLVLSSQKIMSYIVLLNLLLLTGVLIFVVPWGSALSNAWDVNPAGLIAQFSASAVLQIGVAIFVSDFTRYLPRNTSKFGITGAVFGGTLISATWLSVLGAIVVVAAPDLDPISAIRVLGDQSGLFIGTLTMVVAVPSALLATAMGLYSATIVLLSGAEAFRSFTTTKKLRAIMITALGIAVIAVALVLPTEVAANFAVFLTVMGILLIPWTAINLVDFYLVRREVYSISDILLPSGGIYGTWSTRGILSYAAGFLAMLPFVSLPFYVGPVAAALGGADLAFLVGLVVAAASYFLLTRSFDRAGYLEHVRRAEINTFQ